MSGSLKRKELKLVDHTQAGYRPFRKDFYVEAPELILIDDELSILEVMHFIDTHNPEYLDNAHAKIP